MTNYKIQYIGAWATLLIGVVCGAIVTASGAGIDLGIPKVLANWCGVLVTISVALAGYLPSLKRPPVEHDNAGPVGSPDPMPRDR